MGPLEDYLAHLRRQLTTTAEARDTILAEVGAHLEEAAAHARASGLDPTASEAHAVAAFGAPQILARQFNSVHPARWDLQRVARGIAVGALAAWLLWTTVTFAALVILTHQQHFIPGNPPQLFHDPALDTLFYASPLAYGAFWALNTNAPLWLTPFLLLYAVIPFAWGWQSRQGWRPGLIYGLGVVAGFPWLLPAVALRWDGGRGLFVLLVVLLIWLLVPYSMLASVAGARIGARQGARVGAASARLRLPPWATLARWAVVVVTVALVGVDVWSWVQQEAWAGAPHPVAMRQLADAQAKLPYRIQLPTTFPDNMALVQVQSANAGCGEQCWVGLTYQSAHGAHIYLNETNYLSPDVATHAAPDYLVTGGSGGSVHPVWWLYDDTQAWQQHVVYWADHGVGLSLLSEDYTADQLTAVAASMVPLR